MFWTISGGIWQGWVLVLPEYSGRAKTSRVEGIAEASTASFDSSLSLEGLPWVHLSGRVQGHLFLIYIYSRHCDTPQESTFLDVHWQSLLNTQRIQKNLLLCLFNFRRFLGALVTLWLIGSALMISKCQVRIIFWGLTFSIFIRRKHLCTQLSWDRVEKSWWHIRR